MPARFAAQVLLASEADAERAKRAFTALGFAPGAVVGGSFSIEADANVFNAVFGVHVRPRADGGVAVHGASGTVLGNQLPLLSLPASLRPLVAAVLFTEPPAFGPGSFA